MTAPATSAPTFRQCASAAYADVIDFTAKVLLYTLPITFYLVWRFHGTQVEGIGGFASIIFLLKNSLTMRRHAV